MTNAKCIQLARRGGHRACPKPARRGEWRADLASRSRPTRHSSLITRHSIRARQRKRASAFTLLELLIVIGIIGLLLVLIAPAFTYIKGGNDVTSAAYTIKDVLDTARTYAKANNTYTWVGFFEENAPDPSQSPVAAAGVGRIVMSIVASKDGTMIYTGNLQNPVTLDPSRLTQVGKL